MMFFSIVTSLRALVPLNGSGHLSFLIIGYGRRSISFVIGKFRALIWDSVQSRIPEYACDGPNICLLSRVEAEHRERLTKGAFRKVRISDTQYIAFRIAIEFVLVKLASAIPARDIAIFDELGEIGRAHV